MSLRHKALVKMVGDKPHLQFYKPTPFLNDLSQYVESNVYVMIEAEINSKSLNQLGFYNGGIIRDSCMQSEQFGGWEHLEIASFFEDMFLSESLVQIRKTPNGDIPEQIHVRRRVSGLNEKEMSEFIEKVIRWLAMEDIPVRDPDLYVMNKYRTVKTS